MTTPVQVSAELLRSWPLPDPFKTEGKHDRGQVLVVGGSMSVPGSVILAAEAALRAGAGKLQVAVPDEAALAIAVGIPECMVIPVPADRDGELSDSTVGLLQAAKDADAILIGPGMKPSENVRRLVTGMVEEARDNVVLDAGAIEGAKKRRGSRNVLTPNAGEAARFLKIGVNEVIADAAKAAMNMAAQCNSVVALKGATTYIAHPDGRLWIHKGGGPGLGTSGSGDVLAGIVVGLCARGAAPEQAAVTGVWLHAQAGSALAERMGTLGFLARELNQEVPRLLDAIQPASRVTR